MDILKNAGVLNEDSNSALLQPSAVKDNVQGSEQFKNTVSQVMQTAVQKYKKDELASNAYNSIYNGSGIIKTNEDLYADNPKDFFDKSNKDIQKILSDTELSDSDKERVSNTLNNNALNSYFKLQQNVLNKNNIQGREDSIRDFSLQKNDLLGLAVADKNIKNNSIRKFNELLNNSNFGKEYATENEKKYAMEDFHSEYNKEALWKEIDSKPVPQAYKDVFHNVDTEEKYIPLKMMNSLIEDVPITNFENVHKELMDRFMDKTTAIDDADRMYNIQQGIRYDNTVNKLVSLSKKDLSNENTYTHSLEALKSIGDFNRAEELTNDKQFFDNPIIHEKFFGQSDITQNLGKRVLNGTLSNSDLDKMINDRVIDYNTYNSLRKSISSDSESQRYFRDNAKQLTDRYNDYLHTGLENSAQMQSSMVKNNKDFHNNIATTKLYESELSKLQSDIDNKHVKTTEDIQKRIKDIDNRIEGKLIMDNQNTKAFDKQINLSDLRKGIMDIKNNEGIFKGYNQDTIMELIKSKYAE